MRFKQYILNEGRSIEMDFNDALNTIKKDCSKALDQYHQGNRLYRGINTSSIKKSLYIDPKSGKSRKSAYTDNYYTLIMDNSKEWSKYPKRSESIICSTNKQYADAFGVVYYVFPFNGAKIGVGTQYDLWDSFDIPEDLNTFNSLLFELFNNLNIKLDDTNFNTFKKSFKSFDIKMKNPDIRNKIINKKNPNYFIFKYYEDNLLKALEKLLDPKKSGFKLMKIGDDLPFNREVWTDSKSIMINYITTKNELDLL